MSGSLPWVQLDGAKHDSIYRQVSVSHLLLCPAFLLISNKNSLISIVFLNQRKSSWRTWSLEVQILEKIWITIWTLIFMWVINLKTRTNIDWTQVLNAQQVTNFFINAYTVYRLYVGRIPNLRFKVCIYSYKKRCIISFC